MKLSDIANGAHTRLSQQIVMLDELERPGAPVWDRMVDQYPMFIEAKDGKSKPEGVKGVHEWFLRHFIYQPDRPGNDVWRPVARTWEWTELPDHNFKIGIGDCEDYALTVWGYLMGAYRCRIARCRIMPAGTHHAVLLVDLAGTVVIDVRHKDVHTLDSMVRWHRNGWWRWERYEMIDCYDPAAQRWKWCARVPA